VVSDVALVALVSHNCVYLTVNTDMFDYAKNG